MDLTHIFYTPDELADYCMLPDNAAQDARLAERIAELAENGVYIEGMQCAIEPDPQ